MAAMRQTTPDAKRRIRRMKMAIRLPEKQRHLAPIKGQRHLPPSANAAILLNFVTCMDILSHWLRASFLGFCNYLADQTAEARNEGGEQFLVAICRERGYI
jgi:hypothetical protein